MELRAGKPDRSASLQNSDGQSGNNKVDQTTIRATVGLDSGSEAKTEPLPDLAQSRRKEPAITIVSFANKIASWVKRPDRKMEKDPRFVR